MSRQNLFVLLVILAVIGAGAYFALNNKATDNIIVNNSRTIAEEEGSNDSSNSTAPAQNDEPKTAAPATHAVSMSNDAFNPTPLTVKKGDIVVFRNDGTNLSWPASAPHPQHTNYPGFDALRGLEPGESWSFKFDNVGSWNYHDHLHPNMFGTVVVK